ncbi:MAG: ABC-F family ATP-binding cassette domain-containing protein [bacterium]|nr:ABC-F family ATP-binding cassette domain-containing protein [bacterium]
MHVFRACGISKEYGARTLFTEVSFTVEAGEKLGIVGANGTGKTTLVKLLLGLEEPSSGSVTRAEGVRIGYVPQYLASPPGESVEEYLLREFRAQMAAVRAAEKRLASATGDDVEKAMRVYQQARDAFERIEGDQYEARVAKMLEVFGLAAKRVQPVASLSGGEQNVLSLAKALLSRPEVLVLDEPANHLDYVGMAWLEEFLMSFHGTIVMVSHNRYLLDRVVTGILEVAHGRVRRYAGNYSTYRRLKLEEELRQERAYAHYERRVEKLQKLVQRFADLARAHSNWGARYRARLTQLRHVTAEAVAAPAAAQPRAAIRFDGAHTHANIVLRVQNYSKQYNGRVLFEQVSFDITSGERVALVGPNGCGKTTLLRDIVTHGHWHHEYLRVGPSVRIGYVAQQQELLDPRRTVYEELRAAGAASREHALAILARLLFRDEAVDKLVGALSGGERNRLQLARLLVHEPNFLILDEPTNHLDIETCEAVEEALEEFRGTLLVVSHDRYFLDRVATRILEVRERRVVSYPGSYTEFWLTRSAREEAAAQPAERARPHVKETVRTPRPRKPSPYRIEQCERAIAVLEEEKRRCEHAAAEAYAAGRYQEGTRAAQRLSELEAELHRLYADWVALQESQGV